MVKKTKEDFIKEARKVHGGAFCYEKVDLKSYHEKVIITCPLHGDFHQKPYDHIKLGRRCRKCASTNRTQKPRFSTAQIVQRAKEVHGDLYDYSETEYKSSDVKIKVICKEHGGFLVLPHNHIRPRKAVGCPKCARERTLDGRRVSVSEFRERAARVHSGKYDYSMVEYKKLADKVKIVCPVHGLFEQKAANHLGGMGCNACGFERTASSSRLPFSEFVRRAREKHGNKFIYFEDQYDKFEGTTVIFCPYHGKSEQTPSAHCMSNYGCPECTRAGRGITNRTPQSDFIFMAICEHDAKYTYEDVEYVNMWTKVKITCPVHGSFMQLPVGHLSGKGCRECARVRMTLGYDVRHEETTIYLLQLIQNGYKFLKVGVSVDPDRRIRTFKKSVDSVEILRLITGDCKVVFGFEKLLHADPSLEHYWGANFEGRSECYKIKELDEINRRFDELQDTLGE
jgi:hypothetical protein